MKSFAKGIEKLIEKTFWILLLCIMLVLLLKDRTDLTLFYYDISIPNFILAIGAFIVLVFLEQCVKKPYQCKVSFEKILTFSCIVLLAVQLFIAYNIWFYTSWDVGFIRDGAWYYLSSVQDSFSQEYFAMNPNNTILLWLTIGCIKIGELLSFNGYVLLVIISVVAVNVAVYFTARLLYLYTQNETIAYIGFVVAAILCGLSPWMTIPYSDSLSMWIPAVVLYLYVWTRKYQKKQTLCTLGIVFLSVFGYFIKPTNVIMLIAIAIHWLIDLLKTKVSMKKVVRVGLVLLIGVVLAVGVKSAIWTSIQYTQDTSREKPLMHYLLIGTNSAVGGQFTNEDHEYTDSFDGEQLKSQKDLELIKKRLADMGPVGYAKHLVMKTDLNFNSGIFGWGKEIGFYDALNEEKIPKISAFLRDIYYVNGNSVLWNAFGCYGRYFYLFSIAEQFIWILVLLGILSGVKVHYKEEEIVPCISLIGIILFVTLFETNARYLFSFVPIFIVMSCMILKKNVEQTYDSVV